MHVLVCEIYSKFPIKGYLQMNKTKHIGIYMAVSVILP